MEIEARRIAFTEHGAVLVRNCLRDLKEGEVLVKPAFR